MQTVRSYILLFVATVAALIFMTGSAIANDLFFYYNPAFAQNNFVSLKKEMESFMHNTGADMQFQPFARLDDFNVQVKGKEPSFLFLPRWCLEMYQNELDLKLLLQSVRHKSTFYTKVLLTRNKLPITVETIDGKKIATTYMGEDTVGIINSLLGFSEKKDRKELQFVKVIRDVDAILALSLGEVDLAFVAKDNLEMLTDGNPKILKIVRVLAESNPIPLPVLCSLTNHTSPVQENSIKALFLKQDLADKRSKIMELMRIDAWQNVVN